MKKIFIVLTLILVQTQLLFAKDVKVHYLSEYVNRWETYSQKNDIDTKDIYRDYRFDLEKIHYDSDTNKWIEKNSFYDHNVDGWKFITVNDTNGWYYFNDGVMLINKWYNDTDNGENNWYYFNEYGILVENSWQNIDGNWYYFAKTNDKDNYNRGKSLRNCIIDEDGQMFYLNESGIMSTNIKISIGSKEYEAGEDGVLNIVETKVKGM